MKSVYASIVILFLGVAKHFSTDVRTTKFNHKMTSVAYFVISKFVECVILNRGYTGHLYSVLHFEGNITALHCSQLLYNFTVY